MHGAIGMLNFGLKTISKMKAGLGTQRPSFSAVPSQNRPILVLHVAKSKIVLKLASFRRKSQSSLFRS